jgi:hypothetical protein
LVLMNIKAMALLPILLMIVSATGKSWRNVSSVSSPVWVEVDILSGGFLVDEEPAVGKTARLRGICFAVGLLKKLIWVYLRI